MFLTEKEQKNLLKFKFFFKLVLKKTHAITEGEKNLDGLQLIFVFTMLTFWPRTTIPNKCYLIKRILYYPPPGIPSPTFKFWTPWGLHELGKQAHIIHINHSWYIKVVQIKLTKTP